MRVIELHAKHWKSVLDFYDAVGRAQYEHDGRAVANIHNINGLPELLIWDASRRTTPYVIRISGASDLPNAIRDEIVFVQKKLAEAREESVRRRRFDVDVQLEVVA
jgi:hypothetical protein